MGGGAGLLSCLEFGGAFATGEGAGGSGNIDGGERCEVAGGNKASGSGGAARGDGVREGGEREGVEREGGGHTSGGTEGGGMKDGGSKGGGTKGGRTGGGGGGARVCDGPARVTSSLCIKRALATVEVSSVLFRSSSLASSPSWSTGPLTVTVAPTPSMLITPS